jgi:hypothetical protein
MLVSLTNTTHHLEYVKVSSTCTPDYTISCAAAFDRCACLYGMPELAPPAGLVKHPASSTSLLAVPRAPLTRQAV